MVLQNCQNKIKHFNDILIYRYSDNIDFAPLASLASLASMGDLDQDSTLVNKKVHKLSVKKHTHLPGSVLAHSGLLPGNLNRLSDLNKKVLQTVENPSITFIMVHQKRLKIYILTNGNLKIFDI